MLSTEIEDFFKSFPLMNKFFLGIFSINTLKKSIPVNHGLICNTDTDLGPGIHWFCYSDHQKKF